MCNKLASIGPWRLMRVEAGGFPDKTVLIQRLRCWQLGYFGMRSGVSKIPWGKSVARNQKRPESI